MVKERRIQRVNELIKQELNKIFLKYLDFGEGVLVTINAVKTSANLISAVIKISVIPEQKGKEIIDYLNKNIFDIQQNLNKRLKMRPIPKIFFKLDLTEVKAQKVEKIIEEIKSHSQKVEN